MCLHASREENVVEIYWQKSQESLFAGDRLQTWDKVSVGRETRAAPVETHASVGSVGSHGPGVLSKSSVSSGNIALISALLTVPLDNIRFPILSKTPL